MKSGTTLFIKDYATCQDLRKINWNKQALRHWAKHFDINPGECVVFENTTRDKARLVANIGGLVGLFLPPIDTKSQISVHLEVNEFLRVFSGAAPVHKQLDERHEDILVRLERREHCKKLKQQRRARSK